MIIQASYNARFFFKLPALGIFIVLIHVCQNVKKEWRGSESLICQIVEWL